MKHVPKTNLLILMVLVVSLLCYSAESKITPAEKEQLEERVKEHLKKGDVDLRSEVDDIFLLADIYVDDGNDTKAIPLYEAALRVDSWRLEYQLKLAQILLKHGNKNQAVEKAKIVYQYAESEKLIEDAEKFLVELGIKSADINPLGEQKLTENIKIVIVPIGKINKKLLHTIKEHLQEKMGIQYSISEKDLPLGKIDRSEVDTYLSKIVDRIRSHLPKEKVEELLSELNLNETVLEAREPKIKFIHATYTKMGLPQKDIKAFHNTVEEIQNQGQYDAARLYSQLQKTFNIKKESKIKGYLGITEEDIFAKDYNFLYGWADSGYGVMSYHRFTAVFNEAPPNRPRLTKRSLKQGISSSFFILDIPRCTTPTCVRAYSHTLTEHDQKDIEICSSCKEQLSSVINKNK